MSLAVVSSAAWYEVSARSSFGDDRGLVRISDIAHLALEVGHRIGGVGLVLADPVALRAPKFPVAPSHGVDGRFQLGQVRAAQGGRLPLARSVEMVSRRANTLEVPLPKT